MMSTETMNDIIADGEATAILTTGGKHKPITVIGTEAIRSTFDEMFAAGDQFADRVGCDGPCPGPGRALRLWSTCRLRDAFADPYLPRVQLASTLNAQ